MSSSNPQTVSTVETESIEKRAAPKLVGTAIETAPTRPEPVTDEIEYLAYWRTRFAEVELA